MPFFFFWLKLVTSAFVCAAFSLMSYLFVTLHHFSLPLFSYSPLSLNAVPHCFVMPYYYYYFFF